MNLKIIKLECWEIVNRFLHWLLRDFRSQVMADAQGEAEYYTDHEISDLKLDINENDNRIDDLEKRIKELEEKEE